MSLETYTETSPRIEPTLLEGVDELRMAGLCSRSHLHKIDGSICNGTCKLEFGHSGKDECGTCGEPF